jgi:hypothetical protein
MRRRPTRGGRELQASLFAATAPMRTIPAAGYARRVTDRLLELLGPPHALSFDEAWARIMLETPAPIGWRGSGRRGEQAPVDFLRERLLAAWEDDEAVAFSRDDLASIFDRSGPALRAGGRRPGARHVA